MFGGQALFGSIGFCSGYWQLPLEESCQHLHAFMTPEGAVQPTRTAQGGWNSAANFQACVEPCFADLREHLLAWLDDFAAHAEDAAQLLGVLEKFFSVCRERNLKVSLPKSTFFATAIKWCGSILHADGITMDPAKFNSLLTAE